MYTKTKEVFGWPEEPEDFPEPSAVTSSTSKLTSSSSGVAANTSEADTPAPPLPMTVADKLLSSALEVLDGAFAVGSPPPQQGEAKDVHREKAVSLATSLLSLTTPDMVQLHTKSLLASLFASKQAYHIHKDQAQLSHVWSSLCVSGSPDVLDSEVYQRMLVTVRLASFFRMFFCFCFVLSTDI